MSKKKEETGTVMETASLANREESGAEKISAEGIRTGQIHTEEISKNEIGVQETQETPQAEQLLSLAALAALFRVPGWQEAALMRFKDWAPGKMLTQADYAEALGELSGRRIGGGRN